MGAHCCCEDGAEAGVAYIGTEGEAAATAVALERLSKASKDVVILQSDAQASTKQPPPARGDRGTVVTSPAAASDGSPGDAQKRRQASRDLARKTALEAALRARDPMLLPGGHRAGTAVEAMRMQRLARAAEGEAVDDLPLMGVGMGGVREDPIWSELSSNCTSESIRSFVSI
mmetsp:Transcript_25617/g.71925  ORF Transcript_25617/g.71925 Transcript_25617/m.71925 type:complete len:173 (-) Transcript_25617:152-670(-)